MRESLKIHRTHEWACFLFKKSYKTNSLLSHYVEFHRDEMPIAQLNILITAMNSIK